MRGDFARLTFNPTKHYTGVLHQQGRVWLEADWNEDIFDHQNLLWQETNDIVGACGVPDPGIAFQISPNPDPASQPFDFLIAGGPGPRGRYYVDGILCQLEHHVSYLNQPDFPDAPSIQMPAKDGDLRALVYLEVWQRLITYLEDDALREIALGGPDTATRLKTVAQVKVRTVSSKDAPRLTCANADQFLPKVGHGTLTTLQPTDSQPGDLCRLPDPSSYTGRENHLYRVEIHNGGDVIGSGAGFAFTQPLDQNASAGAVTLMLKGKLSSAQLDAIKRAGVVRLMDNDGHIEMAAITAAVVDSSSSTTRLTLSKGLSADFTTAKNATVTGGVARFKWSQDNAAFAVRVKDVSEDRLTLTLSSLGRDQATALRQFDLVEISDDASELGPACGHLTHLSSDPDPDFFTVTIADPLPGNFQKGRHLILRRWDGQGWANAKFVDTDTPDMNLGNGIHIQFGGQDLRTGDYWQFAARSADGSVEILNNVLPMGIIRHTCPLAIVEWNFQVLFDIETIVKVCTEVGLTKDQFALLIQKLKASGKPFWNASEVLVLAWHVGATGGQIQGLSVRLGRLRIPPRLAFTVLEDCRQPFDPLTKRCSCDCTLTVAPGESLQAAFDRISGSGGVVCLLPGTHQLDDTAVVSAKNGLTIRGAGAATIISASTAKGALHFENCVNLTLHDLTISGGQLVTQITGPTPAPGFGPIEEGVVTFIDCQAVRVLGCIVTCPVPFDDRFRNACILFKTDNTSSARRDSPNLDFTLRDCRLYADTGQYGLLATGSQSVPIQGVAIEDNWFLPLAYLDPASFVTVLLELAQDQRARLALRLAQCKAVTMVNNLIRGFASVLSADGDIFLLRDNVSVLCGDGFSISPFTSLRITDNVLSTEGPAVSIIGGSSEVFLSGNDLVRLAATPEFAQNPFQVVSIIADTATLSNNNFRNFTTLDSSVQVMANQITYSSNRSVCSNLPGIADVILLGPTDTNGLTMGSITAVGNTCLEPTSAEVTEFERSPQLQDIRKQQAKLVSQYMATQDPAQRQELLQQLSSVDIKLRQPFAQHLSALVSSQSGPASLLASATFTVTGMNLLSNILVRLGIGSDQGSVEGVF